VNATGEKVAVVKTKHLKNTLEPVWPAIDVAIGHLADFNSGEHMKSSIIIDCYDWNRTSKDDYIGSVTTTLGNLLNSKEKLELINPAKAKSGKKGTAGFLSVNNSKIASQHSFADYLNAGVQISLAVAIDFTGSNGNPNDPNSLHYADPRGGWNPYMFAIHSVCSVLGPYDSNNMIPVYGFGGVIGKSTQVMHDFHVNLDPCNVRTFN
jgi:Copine/C2 domain